VTTAPPAPTTGRPVAPTPHSARLLAAPAPDLATHLAVHGALPGLPGPRVLDLVERATLTGRGGAGFPTAVKLAAVAAARGPAVVVGNGGEGEPASRKDRELLHRAPHLVLDGLQLAARATGATDAFLYCHPEALGAVRAALAERSAQRPAELPVTVVAAATGFVAGQESAVVSQLDGGPAVPGFSRVRITERGYRGRPTLVQNVETLAHLALVVRHGGEAAGGTFLATVHLGAGPRVWEVPLGLPLGDLLAAAVAAPGPDGTPAGPDPDRFGAVLVGGYHGTWLPLPAAASAPLSRAGLAPWGASPGAGVIVPLAAADCGLDVTARIVRYLAAESARQCGPCQFGLPHLARLATEVAAGGAGRPVPMSTVIALRRAVGLVEGRGACHHPDGTARLVRSAMTAFEQDVVLHTQGRCLAHL
jgi:NADH:ubiquinone oxidoreductase subunit F (NADH-binding)